MQISFFIIVVSDGLLLHSSLGGSKEIPIYKGFREVVVNYL